MSCDCSNLFDFPFQITDMILSPEVAFTGDTTSDFMLDPRNADALRAKLLILEVKSPMRMFFCYFSEDI